MPNFSEHIMQNESSSSHMKPYEILFSEEDQKSNYTIKKEQIPVDKLLNDEDSLVNLSSASTEEWQKSAGSSCNSTDAERSFSEEQEEKQPEQTTDSFIPQVLNEIKNVTNDLLSGQINEPKTATEEQSDDEANKTSPQSINSSKNALESSSPTASVHHTSTQDSKATTTTTVRVYQKTRLVFQPSGTSRPSSIYYRQKLSAPLRDDQISRSKTNISIPACYTYAYPETRKQSKKSKEQQNNQALHRSNNCNYWCTLLTIARILVNTMAVIVISLGVVALYYVLEALFSSEY